ncbi:reverse transcriptase/maturase family protein [Vibrio vulnificus]|nr:reverse transcriptase/maturase family protein [Vibrio vulnificus]MCU8172607.1 reverse transcriptase/maturase family protein [Vibrio vulnificus]
MQLKIKPANHEKYTQEQLKSQTAIHKIMIELLISSQQLDAAYLWLCQNRQHYPDNADIWDLRVHWQTEKVRIQQAIKKGNYQFKPLQIITKKDQTTVAIWCASDALVIKLLTDTLEHQLPIHTKCEHVKGHGGGKPSAIKINRIIQQGDYQYVYRTDIKGYYANIDKHILLSQLESVIHDKIILRLLSQIIHYSVELGGEFHTPTKGIARGSSISPLLGAMHLYLIDAYFAQNNNLYYARYMDDFVILTKTRWHLRKAVKRLNQFFNIYGFKQHPDKTFIGRIDKGFDWMGFQFTRDGIVDIAPRSLKKILENIQRLYEQAPQRVAEYLNRSLSYFMGTTDLYRGAKSIYPPRPSSLKGIYPHFSKPTGSVNAPSGAAFK